MGDIGRLRGDGDLGIGGDLDVSRPFAVVGDGQATNLGVVLGRDDHLERGMEIAVLAREVARSSLNATEY